MKEFGIIARIEGDPEPFGKQTFFFKDMLSMGNNLPIKVYLFSPLDWIIGSKKIHAFEFKDGMWDQKIVDIPLIIYDRFTAKEDGEEERYLSFIKYLKLGAYHFSIPNSLIDLLKNKLKFHTFLEDNQIPSLSGIKLSDVNENQIQSYFNYNDTIYVKPIRGSGGQGISILKEKGSNYELKSFNETIELKSEEILQSIRHMFSPEKYFIQPKAQTVDYDDSTYDIRVLIQNDGKGNYQINGMALRLGQKSSWVSNLNAGGKGIALEKMNDFFLAKFNISSNELIDEISQICMKCCSHLVDEYGDFVEIAFDILVTKDLGPIIIEGNSKPARWIFNTISDSYHIDSEEHKKYKNVRSKTVVAPLIFGINQDFKK